MRAEMNQVRRRVKFIEKPRKRALTFMKRRSGIIKKANELAVLCGVDVCMIINAPKEDNKNNDEALDLVWSSSSDSAVAVQELIKKYKQQSLEDKRRIGVYDVRKYYADKKRKAENMLASLKKKNREAYKLLTWNSEFDSMKEHELRDLAEELDSKIDDLKCRRELMKNKRIKTGIHSNPSSEFDRQLWSNGDNDLQSTYMIKPDVDPTVLQTFDHYTPTDLQPRFFHDQKRFDNYNSGAQTEANVFSSSFLMNAMMSTDVPKSSVYDHDTVFDCSPMQQACANRNSQMENFVPRQSSYDLPPLPPLMLDNATNQQVSSQMQYSEQLGLLYNFQ